MIKRPFDLLNNLVGKKVEIGMKAGKIVRGKLLAFDIHMNLVVENPEIVEENSSKSATHIFIRGDSLIYVHPLQE